MSEIIRILFVCHGNICRSPMAEFVMKDLVRRRGYEDRFYIESCATSNEEIGCDIYPPVKWELDKHNIPYSKRAARRMTPNDYGNFDYIVAMDKENLYNMRVFIAGDPDNKVSLLLSFIGEDRGVDDPWYTGKYDIAFRDISKGCEGILTRLRPVLRPE